MNAKTRAAAPEREPRALTLRDLRGRLSLTEAEAAELFGVSVRTARRWMADWIASGGKRGIPAYHVTARRRVVPVGKLLELFGDPEGRPA